MRYNFQQITEDSKGRPVWGVAARATRPNEGTTRLEGQIVTVTKRNGQTSQVRLGSRYDSWNGGRVSVYRIAPSPFQPGRAHATSSRYTLLAERRQQAQGEEIRRSAEEMLSGLRAQYRVVRDNYRAMVEEWEQYEGFDGERPDFERAMDALASKMEQIRDAAEEIKRASFKAQRDLAGSRA